MKYYTEIRGEIKQVKILASNLRLVKIEAYELGERIEALRVKSEVFTSIRKAKKYFK